MPTQLFKMHYCIIKMNVYENDKWGNFFLQVLNMIIIYFITIHCLLKAHCGQGITILIDNNM